MGADLLVMELADAVAMVADAARQAKNERLAAEVEALLGPESLSEEELRSADAEAGEPL